MIYEEEITTGNIIGRLKNILFASSAKKIFIVRGKKSFENCGAKDIIYSIKDSLNVQTIEFSNFSTNPQKEDMLKGLELIKEFRPDIIIGIGGGSVIDMSKLIRYFYIKESSDEKNNNLPLVAIPTTAGTGSECTHFAVMYDEGIKTSVEDELIRPDYVILNPSFTYQNNKYLTACSGFDALAQAIEAFWNINATEESDTWAKKAILQILSNLKEVVKAPDPANRDAMVVGSYQAGKAIDITKTTAPHAFSYGLTSDYNYPHGHAVAIVFPSIMEYNLRNTWKNEGKKIELINILGAKDAREAVDKIQTLISEIGLTPRDGDYSIKKLAKKINAARLSNNPCAIDEDNIEILYRKSLYDEKKR